MNFRRYDGFANHIPQEFIDSHLPVCPFCHSGKPHWLLAQKTELSLAGGRNFYRCECCGGTLSSTLMDAAAEKGKGFAINPTAAALHAIHKGASHQGVTVPFLRVEELGSVCAQADLLGREEPVTFFAELAQGAAPSVATAVPAVTCRHCGAQLPADSAFCSACGKPVEAPAPVASASFCSACGAPLTADNAFCSACGAPVSAPAAPAAPAPVVASAPVAAAPAAAKPAERRVFSLVGAILMLAVALFRTIEAVWFMVENTGWFEHQPMEMLSELGGYLLGIAAAVLIAMRLLARKNDLLLHAGLAALLPVGDLAPWPGVFSAMGILFVLAFAVFSSFPALHGRLKWFTRLWYLPLALLGTALTIDLALYAVRLVALWRIFAVLALAAEYAALILAALWLKSRVGNEDGADLPYTAGNAPSYLGALLMFVMAYQSASGQIYYLDAESIGWLAAQMFIAAGYGILGVMLLLRKKNICLLIAPAAATTGVLLETVIMDQGIGLSLLLELSLWAAVAAFGVFQVVPALRDKTRILGKLWFVPAAVVGTLMTLYLLGYGSVSPFWTVQAAAMALYALWYKISERL